jgi:ElaB/YqjD/DUF883 family membrane-anchored ribosome-binding protein
MSAASEYINGAAHDAEARASAALRQTADLVESSLGHARSAARDGVRAAVDSTRSVAMATDEYVHRKPWVALAATAVTCLALGALLRSR